MARQARGVGVRVQTPEEAANAEVGEAWGLPVPQNGIAQMQREPPEDGESIEETATDRVARMLSSAGQDDRAIVRLYRVTGPNKYAWCDDYSPGDFEAGGFAMIRRKWGVGEYQVRLYGVRPGTNYTAIRAKENITIAETIEAPPPVASAVPNELARVLETMAAQQAALLQALTTRPAAPDPMAQMRDMLGLMTAMRGAMGLDAQASKSGVSEALAIVRELREASSELNPPDDADNPVGALTRMLPSVIDMVKTGMAQQGAQAPQFPVVELPSALTAAPVSSPVTTHFEDDQPQPESVDKMSITTLRMHLAVLIDMASKNMPAAEAAESVYNKAPDEVLDMLGYPGWLDLLGKFESGVLPYREWFTNVAAIVAEIIKEESERGDDGEGPETEPGVHRPEGAQS